jgi:hypothetical protein
MIKVRKILKRYPRREKSDGKNNSFMAILHIGTMGKVADAPACHPSRTADPDSPLMETRYQGI